MNAMGANPEGVEPGRRASRNGPLRVLVNASAMRTGGGGTFIVSQVAALAERRDLDLTVYAAGRVGDELERLSGVRVARPRGRVVVARLAWEQTVLAWRSRDFDVLYCTGNFALFAAPGPQVVVMQNGLHFGEAARRSRLRSPWRSKVRLAAEAVLARLSVKRASAVVAVSESLRRAIEEDTGRRPGVRVVPLAAPSLPRAQAGGEPRPYVLSVAHDQPHKDWDGLVAVFSARTDLPPLVLVGAVSPARQREFGAKAPDGRIRFKGLVADRYELARLYAGAACCVVHSRVESFGLTALEALSSGVPVIASDIPAHREVCGVRCAFYSPFDLDALASLVEQAVPRGRSLRTAERQEGSRTWADNAAEVAAVLHESAARRGGHEGASPRR